MSKSGCTKGLEPNMPSKAVDLLSLSWGCIQSFMTSFDVVLTDCDGVTWLDDRALPGSPDVLNKWSGLGKQVFFVTNNSTKTREEFLAKCQILGFEATVENIMSTAYLTAQYLQSLHFEKKVYIVGSAGIAKELDLVGIRHTEIGADVLSGSLANAVANLELDPEVGAVVVGFDEHISMPKMLKASSYLSNKDCLFVATNTDERFPTSSDKETFVVVPGTGCMVRAIETGACRQAVVLGKPNPYIYEAIKKKHHINPERTLMIGDRCNTDILLGKRCGFKTLLVLSGVTTLEEVEEWSKSSCKEDNDLVPDYYVKKLGDLLPFILTNSPTMESSKPLA